MTVKVLVKVKNNQRNPKIHAVNEATGWALCSDWPRPGGDWELQELDIENFNELRWEERCLTCAAILDREHRPLAPPKKVSKKSSLKAKDVAAWIRWTGEPYKEKVE